MKKTTIDTWKKLHEQGYFKNHHLYDCKTMGIPHCVDIKDIKDKVVVDFGCGYGRDMVLFNLLCSRVYGIDVSQKIIDDAEEFLYKEAGDFAEFNVKFILSEEYKEKISDNSIDYIYSLHVFQHLAPDQAKDYIDTFYKKLKPGGKVQIQFYIGKDKYMKDGTEPRVQYTKAEALELFKDYKIDRTWTLDHYGNKKGKLYQHFYIVGKKQ